MPSTDISSTGARASVVLLLALLAGPAASQTQRASPTLHAFVEAAAARSPDLAGLNGRRDAIGARQFAADALTPGAPTLSGRYVTDQVIRNRQQREAEIAVSTPLWLAGEGTASRRVADAELARAAAQTVAIRLAIAGQVRAGLAEFALAQAEAAVAERRLREARALEADVTRRTRARETSDADALLARAERIAADAELADRRAELAQSRLDFEALTGLAPVAAALDEPVPGAGSGAHPRLDDARGSVDVARANQALIGIQVRDSPEIGLVARRNRDIDGTVYDNSLGVELRIPFATDARNRPRQAAAQAELTEAAAGYAAAEREVGTAQQKARLGYDNARAQRALAQERARTLGQQSALMGRGYQGGEIALFDYIRARTLAYEAQAAASRADIGVARAGSRLNQAFGVIP